MSSVEGSLVVVDQSEVIHAKALKAALSGDAATLTRILSTIGKGNKNLSSHHDDDDSGKEEAAAVSSENEAGGAEDNTASDTGDSTPAPVPAEVEELLVKVFAREAVKGNLLFWGSYKGHSAIMDVYQEKYPSIFAKVLVPVVSHLFTLQKDIPAVSLLVRNGTPSLIVNKGLGQNALHILCSRRTPNVQLITELLRYYSDEDDLDSVTTRGGLSALHLVARNSVGANGRSVATLLLKLGADPEMLCGEGKTVRMMATNPYVRQILGYESLKYRDIPQVDEESRIQIDSCTSADQFPQLPPIDTEPPRLDQTDTSLISQESTSMSSPQRKKVLQPDDVEQMVGRLYTNSIRQREASMAQQLQMLEPVENRRLTREEQDAVGERLWRSEMEQREEKKSQLLDKYSPERERNPLDFETQAESAQRLCNVSLEHKKQSHQALESKYWAPDPKLSKKLTKGEQAASAARLHDECQEKTRETFSAIATKYLDKDKTRFSGGNGKISPDRVKLMADRLSKRK